MDVLLAAQDSDSIGQCIRTILLTNKGEIPFMPEMGVGSHLLMDSNLDRLKISLEVANQVNTYEPRVAVNQVLFMQGETIGAVKIAIKYKVKETGENAAYILNN